MIVRDGRKILNLGVIPAVGVGLLLGSLYFRFRPAPDSKAEAVRVRATLQPAKLGWDTKKPLVPAEPAPRPAPAPERTVATRSEEVRVRLTFQNYRTAVATSNSPLENALRPVLLRDRDLSIAIAQEELARAQSEFDRDIATRVLESMRR
jgi:hypothetical protein